MNYRRLGTIIMAFGVVWMILTGISGVIRAIAIQRDYEQLRQSTGNISRPGARDVVQQRENTERRRQREMVAAFTPVWTGCLIFLVGGTIVVWAKRTSPDPPGGSAEGKSGSSTPPD